MQHEKEKNHRRTLFLEPQDHYGSRNVAKTRLGKYKKHESSSGKTESQSSVKNKAEEVDLDEEAKEGADYTDSQESLLGEIFEADQQIEEYSGHLKTATERVEHVASSFASTI